MPAIAVPENLSTLKRMVADTPTRPPLGDVAHLGHAQLSRHAPRKRSRSAPTSSV